MTVTLQTIVVGTSLSAVSDGIVRTGVAVARATGAAVWLVHVCAPAALPPEIRKGDRSRLGQQLETLRSALGEQARRTGLADLPDFQADRLRLMVGSPAREILALAGAVKADLIVTGPVEGGALRHILLGSTADEVIRKAPCPVLLARAAADFPPSRVEIPVDLSPISANALRQGLSFLAGIGGPPPRTEILFALSPLELEGSLQFSPDQLKRMAAEELDRFLAAGAPSPVPFRRQITTDYPRGAILATLEDRQVDLAILGTHGRGGFKRLVLGSVASEVIRHARCNVLVVPPPPVYSALAARNRAREAQA
ncbi:MAG: universal stress protein [Thermoanaerobaculia bacterium]